MSLSLTFPDGNVKSFDDGVTTKDVASSISISLGKKALAGKLDGKLVDLLAPITADGAIEIITQDSKEALEVLRHTAAFVLADALSQLFPGLRFGQGASTDDGFFYDTDKDNGQVAVTDLEAIKNKMAAIIKAGGKIELASISAADAKRVTRATSSRASSRQTLATQSPATSSATSSTLKKVHCCQI